MKNKRAYNLLAIGLDRIILENVCNNSREFRITSSELILFVDLRSDFIIGQWRSKCSIVNG